MPVEALPNPRKAQKGEKMDLPSVCHVELSWLFDAVANNAIDQETFKEEEEDFPEGSLFSGCGGDWEFSTLRGWKGGRKFIGITGFRYWLTSPWGVTWEYWGTSQEWKFVSRSR
jgi:hypothetical protein